MSPTARDLLATAPEARLTETLATYDAWAEGYASHNDTFVHPRLAPFLERTPAGLVLDAGAGTGRDAECVQIAGHRVLALDASAGMLALAARRGLDVVQGDLRALPLPDSSVAGVWMNASLLHLPRGDALSAFGEAHRVLVPGGRLHVGVKAGSGETSDEVAGLPRHFTMFEEGELHLLAAAAGFSHTEIVVDDADPRGLRWLYLGATA